MNTIGITRIMIYTQRLLETYVETKKAKPLNIVLWVAFSVIAVFSSGIMVGQSIGELVYNLSH